MQTAEELAIGQVVAGKYQVLEVIGTGGSGVVYKVRQLDSNIELALKTLSQKNCSEREIKRFQQEARAAQLLDHPNLVKVVDSGLLDQRPFLVMELVIGTNLAERLELVQTLSISEAASLFSQICIGLAFAHGRNVVHRDIKPSNIMLRRERGPYELGDVKLVDFGIAKLEKEGGEIQALTQTGDIFGSPLYMSPEQCNGHSVDWRSDIYSLGCVLYETLSGVVPFSGDTALATMLKHTMEKPLPLKQITLGQEFPEQLEIMVMRMLEKDPALRYQSVSVLGLDLLKLQSITSDSTINTAHTANGKRAAKPPETARQRHKRFLIATSTAACIVAGTAFIFSSIKTRSALAPPGRSRFAPSISAEHQSTPMLEHLPTRSTAATKSDTASSSQKQQDFSPIFGTSFAMTKDSFESLDGKALERLEFMCVPWTEHIINEKQQKICRFHFPPGFKGDFGLNQKIPQRFESNKSPKVIDVPEGTPVSLTVRNRVLAFWVDPSLLVGFGPNDLDALALRECYISDPSLPTLGRLTGLKALILTNTSTNDAAIPSINKLSQLIELKVQGTHISGQGLLRVRRLKQFASVALGPLKEPGTIFQHLNPNLRGLELYKSNLTPEEMAQISNFKNLSYLCLREDKGLTRIGLAKLKGLKNLLTLNFSGSQIERAALTELQSMSGLTNLIIPRQSGSDELQLLRKSLPGCRTVLDEDEFH